MALSISTASAPQIRKAFSRRGRGHALLTAQLSAASLRHVLQARSQLKNSLSSRATISKARERTSHPVALRSLWNGRAGRSEDAQTAPTRILARERGANGMVEHGVGSLDSEL